MKIGFPELVVVFVVALLAIGPDKLPSYARKLGAALREFRKAAAEATRDVRENVIEPLEEAQRPIREAVEPLTELDREVRQDIRDIEKDFRDIGKPKPAGPEKRREPSVENPVSPEPAAAGEQQADENTGGKNI